jgi:hypothetical protein
MTFKQVHDFVAQNGGDIKLLPWWGEPDRWHGKVSEHYRAEIIRDPASLGYQAKLYSVGFRVNSEYEWNYTTMTHLVPIDWLEARILNDWLYWAKKDYLSELFGYSRDCSEIFAFYMGFDKLYKRFTRLVRNLESEPQYLTDVLLEKLGGKK